MLRSEEVTLDFHPRYTDSHKTYVYQILNAPVQIPVFNRASYYVYEDLDVDAMREAAGYLVGEHDFSAFCSAGAQVKSKVRIVERLDIRENIIDLPSLDNEEDEYIIRHSYSKNNYVRSAESKVIFIEITGNGFLYNMVRIIAGTLIEVGMGRRSPWSVYQALVDRDRAVAGPTAPANGLILKGIRYGEY